MKNRGIKVEKTIKEIPILSVKGGKSKKYWELMVQYSRRRNKMRRRKYIIRLRIKNKLLNYKPTQIRRQIY